MSAKTERSSDNLKTNGWKPSKILRMNGETIGAELDAERQIVTESWNRVVAVPYLVYMPERDQLLMLVSCDYPVRPMIMASFDHGGTWSDPKPVHPGELKTCAVALTYLGRGTVILSFEQEGVMLFSHDYGETWGDPIPHPPTSNGLLAHHWDPYFVDRDSRTREVTRLFRTVYNDGVNDTVNMERDLAAAEKIFSFPVEWPWRSDPEDRGLAEGWHQQVSFDDWPRRMRIDKGWTEQGEKLGLAWYATGFQMPETGGVSLLIMFGAIDGYCDIFVDGRKIGEQKAPPEIMWNQPFYISLKDGLAPGRHTMVIRVKKDCNGAGIHKPIRIFDESLRKKATLDESGRIFPLHTTGNDTSYAGLRFSTDCGRTWSADIVPPSWNEIRGNEVVLCRAGNGAIVAAIRFASPPEVYKATEDYKKLGDIDHLNGLGVSLSKDNGYTWEKANILYDCGRMHPSMVMMPNGDIVMTYVVRLGYPRDKNDFPQYGVEAVISRDNGESWDLAHRYILAKWSGNRKGRTEWTASPQATSTVLLPNGSLLTAYGTGYRSQKLAQSDDSAPLFSPRDVGLVRWRTVSA